MPTRPLVFEQTTFKGMRDSFDPSTSTPELCYSIRNAYVLDREYGSSLVARPGCSRMGASGTEQGGATSYRQVQWVGQYTKRAGTEYTIRICGGRMDTYNWTTDAWTNVTLVGAGVSLPTSGMVFATVFADKLVVNPNDGTNKPWTWDGTNFVLLSNCSALWGPLTVYYGKLFGIKAAERSTLVWSEEADPTTGYEAGGYNNAWTLGQTDQEQLTGIVGTNEALYYWRERSLGAVRGSVTTDFSTDGVREGVSESIGTKSPACLVVEERAIYFLDAEGRPWCLPFGGSLIPLWDAVLETAQRIPISTLSSAVGASFSVAGMVLLGYRASNSSYCNKFFVIDTQNRVVSGIWDGFNYQMLGVVKDSNGAPRVVHGSPNGYCYKMARPDETVWDDNMHTTDGGTTVVTHEVIGPAFGYATADNKMWTRCDLSFVLYTNLTSVALGYTTPRGQSTALSGSLTGGLSLWDISIWDTATWSEEGREKKLTFGWKGYGRWCRPTVSHAYTNERFNLSGWRLLAYPAGSHPSGY